MAKCPTCTKFVESINMQYLRARGPARKAGGWSELFVHTATRFWVPFASCQLLRLTSEAERHVSRKLRVLTNMRNAVHTSRSKHGQATSTE
jgi:hypothetical protein